MPLNEQEMHVLSTQGVTKAKAEFSNSQNSNVSKWEPISGGSVLRQDFLETALDWVSRGNIESMSRHRTSSDMG